MIHVNAWRVDVDLLFSGSSGSDRYEQRETRTIVVVCESLTRIEATLKRSLGFQYEIERISRVSLVADRVALEESYPV